MKPSKPRSQETDPMKFHVAQIDRFMQGAGFGPMSTQEMAGVLQQMQAGPKPRVSQAPQQPQLMPQQTSMPQMLNPQGVA